MRKILAALIVLLFLPASLLAEVKIARKFCIANRNPGYCAWAVLETLGRHHGIEALHDLVESRSKRTIKRWVGNRYVYEPGVWVDYGGHWVRESCNIGTDRGVIQELNNLGVKYKYQPTGVRNRDLFKYAMENDLACATAVREGALTRMAHAITLVHYDDKTVKFIDSNRPDKVCHTTREWFDRNWTGFILVVLPDEE